MSISPNRKSVYQIITERICGLLEQGTIPWRKPWVAGAPQNMLSRKPYRGVNVFMLASTGYASPYWVTFKQAKQRGGSVKRGERGYPVVFWKWIDKRHEDETTEARKGRKIPLLRYYTVFNVEQTTLEAPAIAKRHHDPIPACEEVVGNMPQPPDIRHSEPRAYYRPADDFVNMPKAALFDTAEAYYSTLFHELTHSTGHQSRLKREGITGCIEFGSKNYAREELVAEMGAAFLCSHTGIEPTTIENSAAYVQSWLGRLRGDAKLVVTAAAQAQKAADFILGKQWDDAGEGE